MSLLTDHKYRALSAAVFLLVASLGSTKSKAQTRRDSLVNPGQSGPQGLIGGRPGPSVGRTQPSLGPLRALSLVRQILSTCPFLADVRSATFPCRCREISILTGNRFGGQKLATRAGLPWTWPSISCCTTAWFSSRTAEISHRPKRTTSHQACEPTRLPSSTLRECPMVGTRAIRRVGRSSTISTLSIRSTYPTNAKPG